jgi:hypothetical protein
MEGEWVVGGLCDLFIGVLANKTYFTTEGAESAENTEEALEKSLRSAV